MGIGAWWHWLVVLVVVVLIFGTKKLRNIGGDLGGAVKDFKDAVNEGKKSADSEANDQQSQQTASLIAAEEVQVIAKPVTKRRTSATNKTATAKPKASTKKIATSKPKASNAKKAST